MDDDRTRLITRKASPIAGDADETLAIGLQKSSSGSDDGHTKLYRPSRLAAAPRSTAEQMHADATDTPEDPVVGWLVVIDGPGKGKSVQLGYGMNSIGRSPEERVALIFGDEEISRKGHAAIVYDPRGRKFYIQHGDGTNLTYIGDAPVLQPTELKGWEHVSIGRTKLMFVPFCSQQFDWQD